MKASQVAALFDHCHHYPSHSRPAGEQVVEFDLYHLADESFDQPWGRVIPLPRVAEDPPVTTIDLAEHVAVLYDCAQQTGVDLAELLRLLLTEEARRRAPGTGADGSAGAGG